MSDNSRPRSRLTDVRYWQERAEEARANAEVFKDAATKKVMLDIARGYDVLAQNAERLLASGKAESEK